MLGIRASPSGTHLLLLLRGKPAEIWLVRAPRQCSQPHSPVLEHVALT